MRDRTATHWEPTPLPDPELDRLLQLLFSDRQPGSGAPARPQRRTRAEAAA